MQARLALATDTLTPDLSPPLRAVKEKTGIHRAMGIVSRDSKQKRPPTRNANPRKDQPASNDLIRPALYEGQHEIAPLTQPTGEMRKVDVVGPICESGDFFCQDRELPDFQPGETVALLSAGAYGFVMASNYNSRPLPAEILVDGSTARVVRQRQNLDDLIAGEV